VELFQREDLLEIDAVLFIDRGESTRDFLVRSHRDHAGEALVKWAPKLLSLRSIAPGASTMKAKANIGGADVVCVLKVESLQHLI
jgi:hypothetical protein